ncbi:transporter substrate-binding domain-containing protein [Enterobacter sichuanensis]|uniref:response regulator n=2 Tax=Enterobacter cloacae complex TaxID=354276 RepID=UPI0021D397B2|nr:transporter substrate-binding domain-containing protein [Enterobacter sichuanensis]MCU6428500.1 transporter substrate-binding domain-containing protein [Enterobacter sichuanensis]
MGYRSLIGFLFTILTLNAWAVPSELHLQSRDTVTDLNLHLSDPEWRWLGEKKLLRVASWEPQTPPIDMVVRDSSFEGVSADYLSIASKELGIQVKVFRYQGRKEALAALASGQVDLVIDEPGAPSVNPGKFKATANFIKDYSVLVSNRSKNNRLPSQDAIFKLAVPDDYRTDKEIKIIYPNAIIVRYPSTSTALSALMYDDIDYAMGNIMAVSFSLNRNYNNALSILRVIEGSTTGARFVAADNQAEIVNILDTVLTSIPQSLDDSILNRWFLGSDFSWLSSPPKLTIKELEWIKKHPTVKVLTNPFLVPLTLKDEKENFQGITVDFLNLISLRTGIDFQLIQYDTLEKMFDVLEHEQNAMLSGVLNVPREKEVIYTRPYLITPLVLIVRNDSNAPETLQRGMKVAIATQGFQVNKLSSLYPGVNWVIAPNTTIAMRMVEKKEVDAAIHAEIGATYVIDRYFQGKLKIATRVMENPVEMSFALNKNNRELESIINKTLADIPQRAYEKILNRWQGIPEVPLETWRLYNTQHYIILALLTVLLLATGFWGLSLYRTIRVKNRAQKDLIKELTFRDTLLNGSASPIYVMNQDGHIISENAAWQNYFKHYSQEVLNYPLYDRRHPLAEIFTCIFSQETNNNEINKKYRVYNGKDERIISHWASPLIDAEGNVEGYICGWQDITEAENLLQEVKLQKEKAISANRAKTSFLATMSHEIRTPISAIMGLLELVNASSNENTQNGEAIKLAYNTSQSLLELIGDVLDLAKIESGNLVLEPEWLNVKVLSEGVIQAFEGLAKQKHIALNAIPGSPDELEVFVDGQRIRQVLFNYIGNAVKFTNEGSVTLRHTLTRMSTGEYMLTFTIEDTGVGMSTEDQQRIFTPYSQLEEGKKQIGSGLGLVISAEILRVMGADFLLESTPGLGTKITFSVKVSVREAREQHKTESATPASLIGAQRKLNVLIVDDHSTNRMLLERQLQSLGHKVHAASNGKEAMDIWSPQHDLIITDCQMPVMSGTALTEAIRSTGSDVVIWGLTASALVEEKESCLASGMDDCLFKPLTLEKLKENISFWFEDNDSEDELAELIDIEKLKQLALNDPNLVRDMLTHTCKENKQDILAAERALAEGNLKEVSALCHRIAGAAEILGGFSIIVLSKQIQEKCALNDTETVADSLQRLNLMLSDLEKAVEKYLTC